MSPTAPAPMDGLEFCVLGPLEVRRAGEPVPLGGRQQRAILAMLVCEAGTAFSVGRFADALWGDHPPSAFQVTVQSYIFRLREALEPGRARGSPAQLLVSEPGGGYRLRLGNASVDVVQFETLLGQARLALEATDARGAVDRYDQALALWRGEVLAGLEDFDFVGPIAARLQELRISAEESRADAELMLGHHDTVLPGLDRLVADHPLRERLHERRILALYRSGRQSDALAAYRDLHARLRDELGIEPSPSLQQLHQGVLAQDPSLAWHPPDRPTHSQAEVVTAGPAPRQPRREVDAAPLEQTSGSPAGQPGPVIRRRRLVGAVAAVAMVAASTAAYVAVSRRGTPIRLSPNSVGRIDGTGTVRASVGVGTNPVGVASGAGALWVANRSDHTVSRINPADGSTAQVIDVGQFPEALTVTAHDVWVVNSGGASVTRISIEASKVVGQPIKVGARPGAIAAGPSGVWVANTGSDTIQRIDPDTGAVSKPIDVGSGPDGIAVDADSVWVANGQDGTVWQIDPDDPAAEGRPHTSRVRASRHRPQRIRGVGCRPALAGRDSHRPQDRPGQDYPGR